MMSTELVGSFFSGSNYNKAPKTCYSVGGFSALNPHLLKVLEIPKGLFIYYVIQFGGLGRPPTPIHSWKKCFCLREPVF